MIRAAFALGLLIAGANAAAADACAPAALHLLRHAEKAVAPGDADPPLSDAGRARAQALVGWFEGRRLDAIYSTHLRRTQQTALPLANARDLDLRVLPADADARLLQRLRERHCGGHVLVIGHSNTVPAIAQAFGATPFEIDEHQFGIMHTLTPPSPAVQRDPVGAAAD